MKHWLQIDDLYPALKLWIGRNPTTRAVSAQNSRSRRMLRLFMTALMVPFAQMAAAATFDVDPQSLDDAMNASAMVTTPTKLPTAIEDVPASVTVITGDTIRLLGITSIYEALRLVPGMEVTRKSAPDSPDVRVNYHGLNMSAPRRMNVLVDGVSVFQPAFARVAWTRLPVAIEDVERIEVTRGPNSAIYGPNSMTAVVNIISKHPTDTERLLLTTTIAPQSGALDLTARVAANIESTTLRLTANHVREPGFDSVSLVAGDHDRSYLTRLTMRSTTKLDSTANLDFSASYIDAFQQVPYVESTQVTSPDERNNDFLLSGILGKQIDNHGLLIRASYIRTSLRQSWLTCMPTAYLLPEMHDLWRANPRYVGAVLAGVPPTGGTALDDELAMLAVSAIRRLGSRATSPTCWTPNQNLVESRADIQFEDTYVFSDRLRGVAGMGLRRETGNSATYFGGKVDNYSKLAFIHAEYQALPKVLLHAGVHAESDSLSSKTVLSPRVATNIRLDNSQTIRVVYSVGSRTPDLHERRANWSYTVQDPSPPIPGVPNPIFAQSAQGNPGLESERIRSTELGYFLNLPEYGLLFDARLFNDHLTQLISERLRIAKFSPTNNGSVRLSGAELQANVGLTPAWRGLMTYAYLRNYEASTVNEQTQYSRHSGSVALAYTTTEGVTVTGAVYGASAQGLGQSSYGREDIRIAKSGRLGNIRTTTAVLVSRLDNKDVHVSQESGGTTFSSLRDRLQIFGQISFSF